MGLTVTEFTGGGGAGLTVMTGVVALTDSLVAVIVAVPAPAAVTRPEADTVNTELLLDPQVTRRPVSTFPFASRVCAVSCCVAPMTIGVVAPDSVTLATGGGDAVVTVIELAPSFPSLVARMSIGPPTPAAVTRPLALTLATVIFSDAQVIVRPVSTFPAASLSVTTSC